MSTTSTSHELAQVTAPVVTIDPLQGVERKRWTREEYYRLAEQGWFQDQRVELIEGEIITMAPQSFEHAASGDRTADVLKARFGSGYWVRHQLPLAIDDGSEPEPDISVVSGQLSDYRNHPTTAVLVVEVSKSSLFIDTRIKPAIYARAKVTEYWVLDLEGEQLLVHRDPVADASVAGGHRYKTLITLGKDDSVAPLAKGECEIRVREMLPPV